MAFGGRAERGKIRKCEPESVLRYQKSPHVGAEQSGCLKTPSRVVPQENGIPVPSDRRIWRDFVILIRKKEKRDE